jgi:tetratricopeptide (TPR) repeat protein
MNHSRNPLQRLIPRFVQFLPFAAILALALASSTIRAQADDYREVNLLVRAGKLPEALAKADLYLAAKPRDPQMRFLKGVVQSELGKPQEAIATFTKLTEDFPELPEPYNNLAVLHASQSQFDKARAALEMAIRTNPSYATAHENLGDVYAKLASQAYSKALQLDSSNAAVQPKLALIRELFAPNAKGQKPGPAPSPVPAPVSTPVAAKPVAPASPAVPVVASTPAAVTTPAANPNVGATSQSDVEAAVRAWAAAWSGKDLPSYLAAYGKDFAPAGGQSRKAWEEERRARIVGKKSISVKISNLSVAVNGDKANAKFKQDYSADALNVSSRKVLDMVRVGSNWLIVRENSGG